MCSSGSALAPEHEAAEAARDAVEDGRGVIDLQETGEEEIDHAGGKNARANARCQQDQSQRTLAIDAGVGNSAVNNGIAHQRGQGGYQAGGQNADDKDKELAQIKAVQTLA